MGLLRLNASLILVAGASLAVGACLVQRHAMLGTSSGWSVTQAEIDDGARNAFRDGRDAIIGDSVDLGASSGHNEIVHALLEPLRSISFEATFSDDSYLIVFFNRDATGYAGVRFSRSPLFESIYFEAAPNGHFLTKQPLALQPRIDGESIRFRLELDETGVKIFREEVLLHRAAIRSKPTQSVGFRNGERPVRVGTVSVKLESGVSILPSFWQGWNLWGVSTLVFLFMTGALLLLSRLTLGRRDFSLALATFLISSIVLVVDWAVFSRRSLAPRDDARPRYSPGLHRNKLEALANGHFRDLSMRGRGIRAPRRHSPYTVLFIGASQTLGEGAARSEDRWTERFRQRVRELPIEVKQVAWSRASAQDLAAAVRLEERFDLAVVNVSNYDYDRLTLLRALQSIVSIAQLNDADVLFVLEPNSIEVDDRFLRRKHQVMLDVASGKGIPVLDLHYRLSSDGKYDSGTIWWDYVNLTSYGQKVFSDLLSEYFLGVIKSRGR